MTPGLEGGPPASRDGKGDPSPYAPNPFPESWGVPRTLPLPPAPVGVSPAHERDFQILSSSKMMARRWERSPKNRKRFMVGGIWQGWAAGRLEGGCPPGLLFWPGGWAIRWGRERCPRVGSAPGRGLWEGGAEAGAGGRAGARKSEEGGRGRSPSGRLRPRGRSLGSLAPPTPASPRLLSWAQNVPHRGRPLGTCGVAETRNSQIRAPVPPGSLRLCKGRSPTA